MDFDKWNEIKKETNKKQYPLHFREREIFYIRFGKNIGFEQNGKGGYFLRPVLILRKYNKFSFTGIPLSTKVKEGIYYYNFSFLENITSCALLSQIRTFDANRLERKIGIMKSEDFKNLKNFLKELLKL